MRWGYKLMTIKSPEEVPGPPVGSTIWSFHVHQHLSGFLPAEQQHRRQKTRDTKQEELQRPATKDSIDTWDIKQDNEQNSLTSHTTEHVLVDARVNQGALNYDKKIPFWTCRRTHWTTGPWRRWRSSRIGRSIELQWCRRRASQCTSWLCRVLSFGWGRFCCRHVDCWRIRKWRRILWDQFGHWWLTASWGSFH